jgi:hypothetical protein
MSNKFREPWADGLYCGVMMLISKADDQRIVMNGEIRKRIADCVNACAGMDDPVAEIERLKSIATETAMQNEYVKEAINSLVGWLSEAADSGDHGQSLDKMVDYGKFILTGGADLTAMKKAAEKVNIMSFKKTVIENSISVDFSIPEAAEKIFDVVQKSWHELGQLPPAGTECEFSSDGHHQGFVWCKFHGKIINNEGLIIEFISPTNRKCTIVDSFDPRLTKFRPLQTEKQKMIKEISDMLPSSGFCYDVDECAQKIYDKFIAKKDAS